MRIRLSPSLIMPAALVVAVAGFLLADRAPAASPPDSSAARTPVAIDPPSTDPGTQALPPNHPPIGAAGSPHGPHGGAAMGGAAMGGGEPEAAAIQWTAPADWKPAPSSSSMRLATYRVGDAEMSVIRAGGSTDANVERWVGQFESGATSVRSEKSVHGMKVTFVRIAGTYLGGGMAAPSAGGGDSHGGWAMLAAIVEAGGTPYFFKLLGPADQVDHARPAFDRMIDGISPRKA